MLKMKHVSLISALSFATVMFVGCGDDSGTSVNEDNKGSELAEDSSSGSSLKAQSSSANKKSSSSSKENAKPSSSSVNAANSSSSFCKSSSSNKSSSSSKEATSSSSSSLIELIESSSSVTRVGDVLVDSRDGETYKTVYIGNQHWMAENLRYRAVESDTSKAGKKGRYYSWAVAMDTAETPCNSELCKFDRVQRQGVCPNGWHIPSYEEWKIFLDEINALSSNPLEVITDDKEDWDKPGNNLTGFTAVPAGIYSGGIIYRPYQALIWSSGAAVNGKVFPDYASYLRITEKGVRIETLEKFANISVRCIENSEESEKLDYLNHKEYSGAYGELVDPRDGKKYKTVVLNGLEWMAENLNFETENSVCGGAADSCAKYGRLYPESEYKTVCPTGWRIPKDSEVETLLPFDGYRYVMGHDLKSTSEWVISDSLRDAYDGNGANAIGLNLLPQGFYSDSLSYEGVYQSSGFYIDRSTVYALLVWAEIKEARFRTLRGYYVPVRCVKD